jgi:alpha-L-fucosidase
MEDAEVSYTAQDIRFTAKDDILYAICLGWPEVPVKITSYRQLYEQEIASIRMLGVDIKLDWILTGEGITIFPPKEKPCKHAFVFRIERKHPYAG